MPVYNEAAQLAERITALRTFLDESFPFRALVTVVDNASTDDTSRVAAELAGRLRGVAAMHLPRKGRGYALRAAWSTSDAPVVAYMDVDLSTSLSALLPLVAPLLSGHRDVPIGSRLARGAHVVRGPKRELISRAYNLLSSSRCGAGSATPSADSRRCAGTRREKLLPLVEDNEWFFDTELLVTAERLGLRIGEVPVDWVDDPDSRVDIVSTAADDLRGVWRMLVRRPKGLRRIRSNEVRGRPAPALRRRGRDLDARLPLPLRRLAAARRSPRRQRRGDGDRHALQHGGAPGALPQHRRPGPARPPLRRRGRALRGEPRLHHVRPPRRPVVAPGALLPELVAITVANLAAAVFRFAVLRAWIFRPCARSGAEPMEMSR